MVKRLTAALLLALMLSPPWTAVSAQVTISDKHYRVAAWSFYLQQPAQALETLQLAPAQDARTRLLEAGLYLQLTMPQHAAAVLEALLAETTVSPGILPQALRNVALLQFSRYQLELGHKAAARDYLAQVNITADNAWLGQQQLLSQLVNWPDITIPQTPEIGRLAQHAEMPYIISNQALMLAQQQQSDTALHWLQQLQNRLTTVEQQDFWQLLFSGQWRLLSQTEGYIYPAQERESLADYIALLRAQLHIERQEFAAADAILTNFAADSVLSANALTLYSHILTEQRHIPTLLAVLQQQVKQQPFTLTAWQAATRMGEQLERALQHKDALAAYHWAQQYYQQQISLIEQQARPLQVVQLQQELSQWQQLQLSNDTRLHRLQQDILALGQQLAEAPLRQQRLAKLAQVTEFKLAQQQQLLSNQLPELSMRQQALQQKYVALQQQIAAAEQQPMALALWQGERFDQLRRVERAGQRLLLLQQQQQKTGQYPQRLARLRGILSWHYSDSQTQRQWTHKRAQQQVENALDRLAQQLDALVQQGGKTPRLEQVQQRLVRLSAQQQQLNLALLSWQQQLLAQLNQQLQQRREQQLASLTQLVRHNKESMARVMERVLLSTDTTVAETGL
jgi:hypothetical protein